jgi:hypothetical protein
MVKFVEGKMKKLAVLMGMRIRDELAINNIIS